jgi:hypothetical protein
MKELIGEMLTLNTAVYNSMEDIECSFIARNPFPCVILKGGNFCALFYAKGKSIGKHIMARKLVRVADAANHNGLVYWHFELATELEPLDHTFIIDYAVLLQKIGCAEKGVYTYISKNWSVEMFGGSNCEIFVAQQQTNPTNEELVAKTVFSTRQTSGWI